MVQHQKISPDWADEPCIVAATGPSLTQEVAKRCRFARWMNRWRVIAVNDAYKLMPWADAIYASDLRWWRVHQDCNKFDGEKWSTHEPHGAHIDDKQEAAERWGVRVAHGSAVDRFSTDPSVISYGPNSGFQAINLAILKGCKRIVLVGFNMRRVDGLAHFFGEHPAGLAICHDYSAHVAPFNSAAKRMPEGVEVVNATRDSALTCFQAVDLDEEIRRYDRLYWHRAESVA